MKELITIDFLEKAVLQWSLYHSLIGSQTLRGDLDKSTL